MKPKELTICGWGPYKGEEVVDFTAFEKRGIFLITGATGAGKTTIFDAISYALYGALSGEERDRERAGVRSDFADADTPTFVELLMEHGGKTYRIRRNPEYFRPRKRAGKNDGLTKEKENAVLFHPDGRVVEGVREVNAAVRELLVLDYQQFKRISMIAQGEFARLLVAPPREKTQIFRELFDTGICEAFTQELGQRAREAYAVIAEQRSRLKEDAKLLAAELEGGSWTDGLREQLIGLAGAESPDADRLLACIEQLKKQAELRLEESRKTYEAADRRVEAHAARLAGLEEENRQIERLLKAEKEYVLLQEQEEEYAGKQALYTRAMNAGWVEGAEEKVKQVKRQLDANLHERESVLQPECKRLREKLEQEQKEYLAANRRCAEARACFEAQEHRRMLDAIGIVAELLEEGCPCPVCGSVEHPAPAKGSEDMISEKELKELKKQVQSGEKELMRLHAAAASDKARLESAQGLLDRACESGEQLAGELKEAELSLEKTLSKYGFADRQEFLAARLGIKERERLGNELESYRTRLAAAGELYVHLRESTRNRKLQDLTEESDRLSEERSGREEALRKLKLWERLFAGVQRTGGLMKERLHCMEEQTRRYGYVRDLENIAVGNNKARLVFEQYVLAGYFEEILKAANIRFRRMTGGRYEMSRVPQVGDGRVKDNLEIQVMDFYTGKYRSVRTLSGGESFKASLALALGMSDVIQSINGGIRVDALFVDEGFGALDEESLEQACATLTGLAARSQMIGIISHVPQLREKIENQLVVEKTGSGSRLRCRTGSGSGANQTDRNRQKAQVQSGSAAEKREGRGQSV